CRSPRELAWAALFLAMRGRGLLAGIVCLPGVKGWPARCFSQSSGRCAGPGPSCVPFARTARAGIFLPVAWPARFSLPACCTAPAGISHVAWPVLDRLRTGEKVPPC
ncbi:unnamed protein product, partial [Amoebophrya sp. A120]